MNRTTLVLAAIGTGAVVAGASEYEDAWGPPVGANMPSIAATDQHGTLRDLASLSGDGGLLLVVARSADW